MQMSLKTTLNAYPKVSSDILKDYVSKEDLEAQNYINQDELNTTLSNYVTEAPSDDITYGRENKEWVPMSSEPSVKLNTLYWGPSQLENITNALQAKTLQNNQVIEDSRYDVGITYRSDEDAYFWIVSTTPIDYIILGSMGLIADYIEKEPFAEAGYIYYCFRITDKLLPGLQPFTVNFKQDSNS